LFSKTVVAGEYHKLSGLVICRMKCQVSNNPNLGFVTSLRD